MDDKKHRDTVGLSNRLILENLKLLRDEEVIVRFPFIPGFNDESVNLHAIGAFLQENGFTEICILPYHTAGSDKNERLNQKKPIFTAVPPDEEKLLKAVEILEKYGLTVKIGG